MTCMALLKEMHQCGQEFFTNCYLYNSLYGSNRSSSLVRLYYDTLWP